MNNLNQAYKEVSTIGQYSKKYFSYLGKVLESIDENEINKLGDIFEKLYFVLMIVCAIDIAASISLGWWA